VRPRRDEDSAARLAAVHVTLAAACLALAGIGAVWPRDVVDPLDRIAVGHSGRLTLTLGLFLLGDIAPR